MSAPAVAASRPGFGSSQKSLGYNQGVSFYDAGDYDRAIAAMTSVIDQHQIDLRDAYFIRGLAYDARGDTAKALSDFRAAAHAYRRGRWYDEAVQRVAELEKKLAPAATTSDGPTPWDAPLDIADAYISRGNSYAAEGDFVRARAEFRVALRYLFEDEPRRQEVITIIAEIEKRLAMTPVTPLPSHAPAPTVPLVPLSEPGNPKVFTRGDGGIVVTVSKRVIDGQNAALVSVSGEMKLGDERYFNQALLTVDSPVVVVSLQGPGGIVDTGIKIGRTIWNNQYRTVVEDEFCVSMCAYAWLAGRPRYASPDARIGFHAPWKGDETAAEVSSVGSAVVGGYLADIGFTTAAMAYMTEPGPNDQLQFLTATDAARLGIYFDEWRW